jgi:hypothetical protein
MLNKNRRFARLFSARRRQRGDILLTTLVFAMLGLLIIVPLVSFMGAGLKTARVFNQKASTLYAADAGIEDAIWQIKYDRLSGTFKDHNPTYDPFDFQTTNWNYDLPQLNGKPQINGENVTVNIRNIWIPQNVATPTKTKANDTVNTDKLMVTGGAYGANSFNIVLTYDLAVGESLLLKTIGVWLPPGFTYVDHSSSLEAQVGAAYYTVANTPLNYKGGQVIIWDLGSLNFTQMPDVNTSEMPLTTSVTFDYSAAKSDTRPDGVAWVTTGGVDLDGDGVTTGTHCAWDSDVRVFGITSTAGVTSVDTYIAKSMMRKKGGAINGSYFATGDTMMTGPSSGRNTYHTGSAVVGPPTTEGGDNGVPDDANLAAAYLYWSAWYSDVTRPLNDACTSFSNWTNGGAWQLRTATPGSYTSNQFFGHNYGGAAATLDLTKTTNLSLAAYASESYIVALSWEQWVSNTAALPPLNTETCETLDQWDTATSNSAWSVSTNRFRGHSNTNKDLTLKFDNRIDLHSAASGSITLSWYQWVGGPTPAATDKLNYSLSADGTTFPVTYEAFHGNIGTTPVLYSVTIPDAYLTANFRIKFSLVGFSVTSPSSQYCYIDNIAVSATSAPVYDANDKLMVSITKDGTNWTDFEAFNGSDIGTSPYDHASIYQYNIPLTYLTNSFKFKLRISGFSGLGEYVGIDNIRVNIMQPDMGIPFKINGGTGDKQVYYDADGNPAVGSVELTSKRTQAILSYFNYASSSQSPSPSGYAYSCYRDVTSLVKAYAEQPVSPATNYNGQGTYTVVNSSTNHIGSLSTALSYAGFSIVLIFTSTETQSHMFYLFDTFNGSGQKSGSGLNVAFDFDGDGLPEDHVSGFVVPQRIGNEVNAAKITCFVGEGDVSLSADYFSLNGTKLWDGTTSSAPSETDGGKPNNKTDPENVWNGQSMIADNDGVDIDTLGLDPPNGKYITWDSELIKPGETEAEIIVHTRTDYWFMVYMILAFRSETTTGGSLTYLIHG